MVPAKYNYKAHHFSSVKSRTEETIVLRDREVCQTPSTVVEGTDNGDKETPGDIMKKHHGDLCDFFRNTSIFLASDLYSKELLSVPTYQALLNNTATINQCWLEVEQTIRYKPERATGLIDVIEKETRTAELFFSFVTELKQSQQSLGENS